MRAPWPLLSLALLLASCDPTGGKSVPDDSGLEDSASPDLEDCTVPADPGAVLGERALSATPQPTVFTFEWRPLDDGPGWIELWSQQGPPRIVPVIAGEDGSRTALLIGLKAETSYRYRVVQQIDGERVCDPPEVLDTGALDPSLPTLTLVEHQPGLAAEGYTVLPLLDGGSGQGHWTVVLDANADIVWAQRQDALRAHLSLDHRALIHNDHSYEPDSPSIIGRAPLDGQPALEIVVPGAHTDVVEVEPGVYATFGWDLRHVEDAGRTVAGETILEVSADGETRVVWSLFDAAEPVFDHPFIPEPGWSVEAEVWGHLNHLHYDAEEDAYYVSARFLDTVYRVERATGRTSWVLGQGGGDFQSDGGAIEFNPHSAVPTRDGVLLFDTGSTPSEGCSAAAEFALDTDAWSVRPTWLYHTEDCLTSGYLGNAALLDNGNRLLVLATNGQIDEVTPAGELAWRARAPWGWYLGYASHEHVLFP